MKERLSGGQKAEDAVEASPAEAAYPDPPTEPAEVPAPISEEASAEAPEETPDEVPEEAPDESLDETLKAFGWRVHESAASELAEAFALASILPELPRVSVRKTEPPKASAEVLPEEALAAEPVPVPEEGTAAEDDVPAGKDAAAGGVPEGTEEGTFPVDETAADVIEETAVFHPVTDDDAAEKTADETDASDPDAHRGEEPDETAVEDGETSLVPDEPDGEKKTEETHIFTKEDMDDLSDKDKKRSTEEGRGEKDDRRPTKRVREKKKEEKKVPKPVGPEEEEYTARDYRPIRRNRGYRTGLRGGLMYFGFVICVSVILASVAWLAADDVLSLNKDLVEQEIYVGDERDVEQVSTELYNKGLIKYRKLFSIFAKLTKADEKIEPGVYTISSKLDYNAMIHAMHQSTDTLKERDTVTVMIPEGKTLRQTFQILNEHGVCPYETLLECAANYDFKYSFLKDLPLGDENRLEGYLFPDTYEFFAPSTPEEAINRFLSNFETKLTSEMKEKAESMGYTFHEILTVASLIEMEAGTDTERPTVASVIYNRLTSSYYPYLQIDATIQYALGERKESLTYQDLEIDSPYNTYKYTGLPPGPIANPGMASIRAALNPESTGYYFYALNKKGSHNFFSTLSQFERFINSSEFGG